jgi:hypothetical protein
MSLNAEINPSYDYRKDTLKCLTRFIAFCRKEREAKKLKQLDRKYVLAFLDSFRKSEIADPLHRWIGTYNLLATSKSFWKSSSGAIYEMVYAL